MIIREIVKDGNNQVELFWNIDTTLPKAYLEGNCYKFNSTLVARVIVGTTKRSM